MVQASWLLQPTHPIWLTLKQAHSIALNTAKQKKREVLLAEQARIAKELEELNKG